jgi:ATP-dependent Clp protease ATP-binding subunit ClpC
VDFFESAEELLAKWKAVEQPKFTPRAMRVLQMALAEAQRLNHDSVGTEYILFGLAALGQGVAVNVLNKMGFTLEYVRAEIERSLAKNTAVIGNRIPYTPRVKKVLEEAGKEADAYRHTYIGTEHILLGLLGEKEGPAYEILLNLGVNMHEMQSELRKELEPRSL